MKYPKLTALLGLTNISLHSGTFGLNSPFAKINEEDLEKIDNALAQENSERIRNLIKDLAEAKEESKELQNKVESIETAVAGAMELAGLEAQETAEANISLLGEKCKEYGNSNNRHSFPENSGNEELADGLVEGYLDTNDAHNQLLTKILK